MKNAFINRMWMDENSVLFYYGPGDAIARVSRSSMVALHTLLFCVLHVNP